MKIMLRLFTALALFCALRPDAIEARTCGTIATTHVEAQSLARVGCRGWDGAVSPIDDTELAARVAYVDATAPPPSPWDTVKRPMWVLCYLTDIISTPAQDPDTFNGPLYYASGAPLTSLWYPSTPPNIRLYTGREFFCLMTDSDCQGLTLPPHP